MTAPVVACPTCKREVAFTAGSRWRPFCSERCRMVDLGAWFSEERSIPGEPADELAAPDTSSPHPGKLS